MKNRSSKTILVFFALGLISCAFCVQQAQAVPIHRCYHFRRGRRVERPGTVNSASAGHGLVGRGGFMPTVQSVSGNFAAFVTVGDLVTFTAPWSFTSGPIAMFWTVDGFTFNLIASNIVFQGGGFLFVSGTGTITGHGFNATVALGALALRMTQQTACFPFLARVRSPTAVLRLLCSGLALAGIEGIRRKLMRAKS